MTKRLFESKGFLKRVKSYRGERCIEVKTFNSFLLLISISKNVVPRSHAPPTLLWHKEMDARSTVKSTVKGSAALGRHLDTPSGGWTILFPHYTRRNPWSMKELFSEKNWSKQNVLRWLDHDRTVSLGAPPPPQSAIHCWKALVEEIIL